MYVRVTRFEVDPSRLSELPDRISRIAPIAKSLAGVIDIFVAWRDDGHGIVVASYESEAAAAKAAGRLQVVWGELAGLLRSAPRTDIYDKGARVAGWNASAR